MKRRQLIRKISLECLKVAAVLLIAFGTAFFWNNQSEKPATKSDGAFFIKYLPKPIIVNGRSKSIINIKIQNPIVNLLYYNSRFFRNSGSTSCSIIFNQFLSKTFLSSKDPLRSKYCCHSACDAQHNIQHRTPFCPLFYQLTGFKCERGKCRKTST